MISYSKADEQFFDERKEGFVQRVMGKIDLESMLICPIKSCPERGEYLMCYYDKYPNCKIYREAQQNGTK